MCDFALMLVIVAKANGELIIHVGLATTTIATITVSCVSKNALSTGGRSAEFSLFPCVRRERLLFSLLGGTGNGENKQQHASRAAGRNGKANLHSSSLCRSSAWPWFICCCYTPYTPPHTHATKRSLDWQKQKMARESLSREKSFASRSSFGIYLEMFFFNLSKFEKNNGEDVTMQGTFHSSLAFSNHQILFYDGI